VKAFRFILNQYSLVGKELATRRSLQFVSSLIKKNHTRFIALVISQSIDYTRHFKSIQLQTKASVLSIFFNSTVMTEHKLSLIVLFYWKRKQIDSCLVSCVLAGGIIYRSWWAWTLQQQQRPPKKLIKI
jgi:hypothetical protein